MDSNSETKSQTWVIHLPNTKAILIGMVLLCLVGLVVFAALREVDTLLTDKVKVSSYGSEPVRPPLTAAEEQYASALSPIYGDIKISAVGMTFAGLSYKLGELDRDGLKSALKPLIGNFEGVEARLRELTPPASMEKTHWSYVKAVKLYQGAVTEMAKVVNDGREDHLIKAQEQSEMAATILLKVGTDLWPGEYKPN
jgi:hypothetical protein